MYEGYREAGVVIRPGQTERMTKQRVKAVTEELQEVKWRGHLMQASIKVGLSLEWKVLVVLVYPCIPRD